ncbi:odorant receptor 13a-like isoform X3 [Apis dorsata]|nr:odorant receptor 13a-like isoform X3 [Apis dorsata]
MFNVGFTCVGVDTVGALFILITCGYFDTIQSRIENLHSFDTSLSSSLSLLNILSRKITTAKMSDIKTETSNSVQMKNLRICVIHHQLLLKFCEDIEHLTSGMFFIQVIASTYNISLVGFKLLEDTPDKFKYITQLIILIIQLFLCNWPADLLLSKSVDISRATYSMPWYGYSYNLQKITNILMVRSQKAVRLTAGKFIGLSLETFASMISTAASFFTMVRSMN